MSRFLNSIWQLPMLAWLRRAWAIIRAWAGLLVKAWPVSAVWLVLLATFFIPALPAEQVGEVLLDYIGPSGVNWSRFLVTLFACAALGMVLVYWTGELLEEAIRSHSPHGRRAKALRVVTLAFPFASVAYALVVLPASESRFSYLGLAAITLLALAVAIGLMIRHLRTLPADGALLPARDWRAIGARLAL